MLAHLEYLHQIVEQSARTYNENIAIKQLDSRSISYRDLANHSQSIEAIFTSQQITAQSRMVFYCKKSIDCIASFFACSALQLIYVPVSTLNPFDRFKQITQLCSAEYLVVDHDNLEIIELISQHFSVQSQQAIESLVLIRIQYSVAPLPSSSIAYILFTSGSTGIPKGVAISHQAALIFIQWCRKEFQMNESDTILSIAPFNFDLSVFDIYSTLSAGATLCISSEESTKNPMLIASLLDQHKINTLYATPTFYNTLLQYGKLHKYDFTYMKNILFAGEIFKPIAVQQLQEVFNQANLYNLYGPTETNVCTYYKVPKNGHSIPTESYPIGIACEYATCILLDENNQQITLPHHKAELIVSGKSLFKVYWGDEHQTLSSEIVIDQVRYYKTGDIAYYNEEMQLVYSHRKDQMIKKNGYRIELVELETALANIDNINKVACLFFSEKNEVICFYTTLNTNEFNTLELKTAALRFLPGYMVPDKFVYLSSFPVTVNGKTDKIQLIKSYVA